MNYNPKIHHRRSIRLKGYDYAQAGLYFITICTNHRQHIFGEVLNSQMILNAAGKMADECWQAIPKHFPNAILHEFVVMPNHVHGIIELTNLVGAKNISPPQNISPHDPTGAKDISPRQAQFKSPSMTIGSVVRGYKIGVTKWCRNNTNIFNVWQRDYYEHIIRNEMAFQRIARYIINNPANWKDDKFYK